MPEIWLKGPGGHPVAVDAGGGLEAAYRRIGYVDSEPPGAGEPEETGEVDDFGEPVPDAGGEIPPGETYEE